MAQKKLKFSSSASMFGINVRLSSKDGVVDDLVGENLQFDPFKNYVQNMKDGFMFRSPNIKASDWTDTLRSLSDIEGKYTIDISYDQKDKSTCAVLTIAEKDDAAVFAWSNVEVWQKWSRAQEKEEKERKKEKSTIFVDENGNLKAKVTVTSIGD
jgi:hypothetical protein